MNHTELSHMAGAVDDSTINIVVVIIIIIIINTCAVLKTIIWLDLYPIVSGCEMVLPPQNGPIAKFVQIIVCVHVGSSRNSNSIFIVFVWSLGIHTFCVIG